MKRGDVVIVNKLLYEGDELPRLGILLNFNPSFSEVVLNEKGPTCLIASLHLMPISKLDVIESVVKDILKDALNSGLFKEKFKALETATYLPDEEDWGFPFNE